MLRGIALVLLLISRMTYADATLTGTRFTSCKNEVCIEIKSQKAFQGNLGNGIYFAAPTVRMVIKGNTEKTWFAESVFFDAASDRLFIRALQKNSGTKNFEAYYEILRGKLHILGEPRLS